MRSFQSELTSRLRSLPGVNSVGVTSNMLLSGHAGTGGLTIEERPVEDPNNRPVAAVRRNRYPTGMGGTAGSIIKLTFKDGLSMVAVGTALGLLASFELTQLMSDMLFGVAASDPLTYVVTPCVLAATALPACYVPVHKALRSDVMTALRHE